MIISFIYMSVHLLRYSFKKGEEMAFQREEYIYPMTKAALFKANRISLWKFKTKILGYFNKKYKLMGIEANNPYSTPFSSELMKIIAESDKTENIIKEVVQIFDYKEKRAYEAFDFKDDFEVSRFSQFWIVRKEIAEHRIKNIVGVVYEQYKTGRLNKYEEQNWISRFEEVGLVESKTEEIHFVGEMLTVGEYKELGEENVVLRDVSKKRVARFD